MKTAFCRLFFRLFVCLATLAGGAPVQAQSIPVDHFPGLRFDTPVAAQVRSGDPVPLSGELLDDTWHEALFSFRPLDGGDELNVYIQHLPGRVERTFTFAHSQVDSYQVILFAGPGGGQLEFQGSWEPFVVAPGSGPVALPARFFDGMRLDAPLSTAVPLGAALPLAATVTDERIASLRLDLTRDGASLGSVSLPIDGDRVDVPLRLPVTAPGPVRLELVAGLTDGTFWGRGAFTFQALPADGPAAAPDVLSAALLPGLRGEIPLANVGGADLHVLAALVTPPFEVVDGTGATIEPGATGVVGVRYSGPGGDEGELILRTDDPLRPERRVTLVGLADGGAGASLSWVRAAAGVLEVPAPPAGSRFALALFSGSHSLEPNVRFPLQVGPPAPAARSAASRTVETAAPRDPRYAGEARRDRRAAQLADAVRRLGLPARRAAQAHYAVGDERTFVFDEYPPVARQVLPVRVVAVSARAVAFVHVGTEADGGALSAAQIQAHLDGFDADYDAIVAAFGAPSDVDGDGRIGFVYSPLVDAIGLGGFQDPASVLDVTFGGSGNLTDLLFLSPSQPAASYRSLLVHEFQHLISFHQHVLVRGGKAEATWLNEGLSHLAEDLVDGFVAGGNAHNAQTYLADPSAAGLTAQGYVNAAERGAAYLFVRSLVDRFGEDVLLRLVQTGLTDRDNVESAVDLPFRELLAGFAVRLYASGTGLAGHSRFDFNFAGLANDGVRGFPRPAVLQAAGGAFGFIRPRGVAFVEGAAPGVRLQISPDAELGAVVIPLPDDWAPRVDVPAGYFPGVRFDPPLPGVLRAGEPLRLAGRVTAPGIAHLTLRYTGDGDTQASFFVSVDADGRFDRTVVLAPEWAGDLKLDVFLIGGPDNGFVGSFDPVRVGDPGGPVFLPPGYFHGLRLDAPLPTLWTPGPPLEITGQVLSESIVAIAFELAGADGEEPRVLQVPVRDGRFVVDLPPPDAPAGALELRVFAGGEAGLTLRGAFPVTIGAPVTAVVDAGAARPQAFALEPPYPNPFNATVVVPLRLRVGGVVDVAAYNLAGQRVADLWYGSLASGSHALRWDGRDSAGRPAASGLYWIRASGAAGDAVRKVLLLR